MVASDRSDGCQVLKLRVHITVAEFACTENFPIVSNEPGSTCIPAIVAVLASS